MRERGRERERERERERVGKREQDRGTDSSVCIANFEAITSKF